MWLVIMLHLAVDLHAVSPSPMRRFPTLWHHNGEDDSVEPLVRIVQRPDFVLACTTVVIRTGGSDDAGAATGQRHKCWHVVGVDAGRGRDTNHACPHMPRLAWETIVSPEDRIRRIPGEHLGVGSRRTCWSLHALRPAWTLWTLGPLSTRSTRSTLGPLAALGSLQSLRTPVPLECLQYLGGDLLRARNDVFLSGVSSATEHKHQNECHHRPRRAMAPPRHILHDAPPDGTEIGLFSCVSKSAPRRPRSHWGRPQQSSPDPGAGAICGLLRRLAAGCRGECSSGLKEGRKATDER